MKFKYYDIESKILRILFLSIEKFDSNLLSIFH